MDIDGGGYTLELQAAQIARNATLYKGSAPCPTCGVIMNPVEYMYSKGLCPSCHETRMATRMKGKLA
jgi:Zn finger protein HypA/HybF involved in hydrogenase expression